MVATESCRIIDVTDLSDAFLFLDEKPFPSTDILSADGCDLIIKDINIHFKIKFCYQQGTDKFWGVAYIIFDNDDRDMLIDWDQPVDEQELSNYVKTLVEEQFVMSGQEMLEVYNNHLSLN